MTGSTAPCIFAALRCRLTQTDPNWLEAGTLAWQGWWQMSSRTLPRPGLPQVVIIARIRCVDDIALHRGLLQLLSLGTIQPLVLFALPTAEALALVRRQALREGWASLVTLMAEAELGAAFRQLPDNMPIALFPCPAPVPLPAMETLSRKEDAGCFAEAWEGLGNLADGCFLGTAGQFSGLDEVNASFTEPFIQALVGTKLPEPIGMTESSSLDPLVADGECKGQGNEIWLRREEVELPSAGRNALLAVTVLGVGGKSQVMAIQSGNLAPLHKGMNIPVLPRHASEAEQRMRIHVLSGSGGRTSHEIRFNVPPANIEPWMLSAYLNRGGGGNPVIRAFAGGTGCRLAYAEDEPEELRDIPVVWGVLRDSDRILAQAQSQGLHFFYIDHAYFDRGHGKSYRITRNRFEAGDIRNVGDDRLSLLDLHIQPWRKNGRSIIVCPPTDYFIAAHGCADWLDTTLAALRLETDRPIIVREKPQPGQSFVPLPQALRDAHALVTHSSNVAIEAACLGTPVFVSPTSAAAPIGRTNIGLIETPRYPDRHEWLSHLAYSQYSMSEIRDGSAWELLKYLEDCEFV